MKYKIEELPRAFTGAVKRKKGFEEGHFQKHKNGKILMFIGDKKNKFEIVSAEDIHYIRKSLLSEDA
jgi:hypothetical protein